MRKAIAEQEAAERAEFDAKMAQVNSVIQSTGREALSWQFPHQGSSRCHCCTNEVL